MISGTLTPSHYAASEGGKWHVWPSWVEFNAEVLAKRNPKVVLASPHDGRNPSSPLLVHSIAFDDPGKDPVKKGWGKFGRWDCINGWTCE